MPRIAPRGYATRRRRGVIAGLLALTVIAISAAGLAVRDAANPSRQAANASRQHAIALSRQLAAESLAADSTNPLTARRLAVAAWRIFPTDQAGSVLASLLMEQQQRGILPGNPFNCGVNVGGLQPGRQAAGRRLQRRLCAAVESRHRAGRRRSPPGRYRPGGSVSGMAFSPDGKLLATAGRDGYVRLWNPATGQAVGAPLPADTGPAGA